MLTDILIPSIHAIVGKNKESRPNKQRNLKCNFFFKKYNFTPIIICKRKRKYKPKHNKCDNKPLISKTIYNGSNRFVQETTEVFIWQ